jgi:RimJ/RimL family protein N-acetyltransferase
VRLEPLAEAHREHLRLTCDADDEIWASMRELGATEEGVARQASGAWTGRTRDLVMFSILADEWPGVCERLEERLAAF